MGNFFSSNLYNRACKLCLGFSLIFTPYAFAQNPQQSQGVDVSDNNSTNGFSAQDWQTIKNSLKLKFAYAKATEGKTFQSNSFNTNMVNGKSAQLIMGAYHFARPDNNSAADEANSFLQVAGKYVGVGYLPPALDLEDIYENNKLIASPAALFSKQALTNWAVIWLSTVEKAAKVAPILYVNDSYATSAIDLPTLISPVTGKPYQLWIADPSNKYLGTWLFKQFTSKSSPTMVTINGSKYGFDRDEFTGDDNALSALVAGISGNGLPDLTVTAGTQSAIPSSVVAGSSLTVSCSEDNSGDADAGANNVTVWLSSDAILTGSDTYLGKIPFSSVAANSNSLINSSTVQIPPGTPAGTYYLFFWADGNQAVPESDETNNFASQIVTVSASQQTSVSLTLVPQCNGTSGGMVLNWNIVPGASSYTIYRNGTIYTSITGTQFNNTNVVAGQTYSYYIVAQISSGNITSNTVSSTAPDCSSTNVPGAFALTIASQCTGNTSQITLNWSNSNNAMSYDVYRNNGLYAPSVAGVQFVDESISVGQSYNYYIIAKNSSGTTNSNTQSATAQNCSTAVLPGTPTLTVTPVCNGSASQIKLDWTATDNTEAYDIYRNHNFYTTVRSGTEYIDELVTAGLPYLYYVRATNGSGGSNSTAQSTNASNCTALPLPAVPTLSAQASCAGGTGKIILNWTADNNTNSYDIYRNNNYYTSVNNGTQFIDYSITPDSAYFYYLEAKNSIGSTDSQVQFASALDCTPNLPSAPVLNITASCNGTSPQVTLDWTTSNNAVAYDVYRDNTLLYTAFYDTREYVDNNIPAGTNHTYYIAASNGSGLTNSNTESITTPSCTPIPSISSISPQTAEIGTSVTINGANFDNSTAVTFGGVPAQSVNVVSSTEVQAVVSTGSTGNVVVTNQGGSATFSGFNFVFSLPPGNFTVSANSATCKGSANGSIYITANEVLNYSATITGSGVNSTQDFTIVDSLTNLTAGTYHVCISVPSQPGYQQCYDVKITEPKDLSVYSTVNDIDNTVNLSLAGGTTYNIVLNGNSYSTSNSFITLPVKEGTNQLKVTTDKLCQGSYQTIINILKKIIPFPDPFDNILSVNIGLERVGIAVFEVHNTLDGKILYSKQFFNQAGVVQLDLSNLREGAYALHIKLDNIERVYKIIKK